MRLIKRKRKTRTLLTDISLTPLIDTALTLLIIFMVTTPMLHSSLRVNLPKGNGKTVAPAQELVVTIDKNNHLFFEDQQLTLLQLVDILRNKEVGYTLCVRGDQEARYGQIMELIKHIQQQVGQIEKVALITRQAP